MSNVKQVLISGVMPFSITDHAESAKWLGLLNGPVIGVRIAYGGSHYAPNARGGKTSMHDFTIAGEEAMSFKAFENMIHEFENGGAIINRVSIRDIEDGHDEWEWSRG
jgi:hypothetical protein